MPFEMLKQPLFMYQDPSKIPPFLQKASKEISSADGFIFVSAEYYNSMPPALSNMVDHFAPWDYLYKPSAIITYSSGTNQVIHFIVGNWKDYFTKAINPNLFNLYSCVTKFSVCKLGVFLHAMRSVAERLALPTSDHGVAGSNPAGGESLPEPKRRFIAQSLSCSPFHRLEMTEIL